MFIKELQAVVRDVYQVGIDGEWFIRFHQHASVGVGHDKPEISPGDLLKITLERVHTQS